MTTLTGGIFLVAIAYTMVLLIFKLDYWQPYRFLPMFFNSLNVCEIGEINKTLLVKEMKSRFRISVIERLNTSAFRFLSTPVLVPTMATLNMLRYVEKRITSMWKN